jgi:hypothetical protein
VGFTTRTQYAKIPVRVIVAHRSQQVASRVVYGGHTFRFDEPVGTYAVTSNQMGPDISPTTVMVSNGKTIDIRLDPACK